MLNSQPGLLILKGGERQRMAKSCGKICGLLVRLSSWVAVLGMAFDLSLCTVSAVPKGCWSSEEDAILEKLVGEHGVSRWDLVAEGLPEHTPEDCQIRWDTVICPEVRGMILAFWRAATGIEA